MKDRRIPSAVPTLGGAGAPEREHDEGDESESVSGNAAAQQKLRDGGEPEDPPSVLDAFAGQAAGTPAAPPTDAGGGDDGGLPFRADMEAAFDEDFAGVQVLVGQTGLGAMGALAAAGDETVSFRSPSPDKKTVAHEVAHLVQKRHSGPARGAAISQPSDPSEVEADAVAARVAAGGRAGSISAAPAAVPRKAAGEPRGPRTERVLGRAYTVVSDEAWAAMPTKPVAIPGSYMPETIPESVYRQKVADAGRLLFDTLIAVNLRDANELLFDGPAKVKELLAAAEPAVELAAFELLRGSPQAADVKLARVLTAQLDPLSQMYAILQSDHDGRRKIETIQAWAALYGHEHCERALADGAIQILLNQEALGRDGSIKARMYLIGGGVFEDTPYTRMQVAMLSKKTDEFLGAWKAFKEADAMVAYATLQDASFLEDVRFWVKDAYPAVLDDLVRFKPTPAADPAAVTSPTALNAAAKDAVHAKLIPPAAMRIARSVVDTGGIAPYWGEKADPAFRAAAGMVMDLRRAVVAEQAIDATTPDGRAAAISAEKEALALLAARPEIQALGNYGTAEGRAPFRQALQTGDFEVGKRVIRDSGQTTLSAEELAATKALAADFAGRLLAAQGKPDPDEQARALLYEFSAQSGGKVRRAGTGDPLEEWATSERKRRAQEVLDAEFRTRTGKPLRAWLAELQGRWKAPTLVAAWDVLGAEQDIQDDPKAYSEALTDLDRKKIAKPFADASGLLGPLVEKVGTRVAQNQVPAGMTGSKSGFQLELSLSREHAALILGKLESDVRDVLKPRTADGKSAATWERKVRNAMRAFEGEFEAAHGSLRKAIDDGGGDGKHQRSALTLLGDRDEATFALEQQVIGGVQGDATGAHDFVVLFSKSVGGLAERLYAKLKPAIVASAADSIMPGAEAKQRLSIDIEVDNSDVLDLCGEFSGLADMYVKKVPGGKRGDATQFLVAAFARMGGSLEVPIVKGLGGGDESSRALSLLGLRYRGLGGSETEDLKQVSLANTGWIDVDPRKEDFTTFADRLGHRAMSLSRALDGLSGDAGGYLRPHAFGKVRSQAAMLGKLASLADGWAPMLSRLWEERLGIRLADDLGWHLLGEERQTLPPLLGVDPGALATSRPSGRWDDPVALKAFVDEHVRDPYAYLTRWGVRPDQVDPEFTAIEARSRAFELHDVAGGLPGTRTRLMDLLAGGRKGNARPAEATVVLGMYREAFGHDILYRLRQAMPDDPEKVEEFASVVKTGGKGSPGRVLLQYARTKDGKEVLRHALRLSNAERTAILADASMLGELRVALGENDYGRLYRTLNGQLTLYDVVRSDKDVGAHIEEFFEGRRRSLMDDPDLKAQAGGDPRKLASLVESRVRQEGREAFADPAMRKVLDERFGAEKDFEIRARILGGGRMSQRDLATRAVMESDATDEAGLRAAFEGMSPAERERVRNDPFFQRRISADLMDGGDDWKDSRRVFAEMGSEPGANGMAKLEEARDARSQGGPQDRRDDAKYDAGKAMDAILGMSPAEIDTLRSNPDDLHRVRASLDEGRRKRLDAYLASVETSQRKSPSASASDQRAAFLVEQYAARFIEHRSSVKKVFQIAQECFGEKGLLPDPTGKDKPPIETFGARQRAQVWARIEDHLDIGMGREMRVEMALIRGVDPTLARLDEAFAGKDNQAEIIAAIDGASVGQILEWSNTLTHGPNPKYGSLKEKFEDYTAARQRFAAAQQASRAPAADPAVLATAENEFAAARNRYFDHRLDLSTDAMEWFSSGGGDTKVIAGGFSFKAAPDTPAAKRLLEMKDHIRRRIWSLTAEDVGERVGLKDPGPPPAATNDPQADLRAAQEHEQARSDYEAEKELLIGRDRMTRSEFVQRADVYTHERGAGSGRGAETEGSRVDVAYQNYRSELGEGLQDSQLSPAEIAKVTAAGGDFDRKVTEYKQAKARLSGILKIIFKALIIAVATALTGGTMGVLATLLVAGAGAMSDNLIDSIVLGNDFDWQEDGVKHLLTEMGTAAFTLGMGKVLKVVAAPLGIAGKFQKVAAFEQRLAQGATQSFGGMAINFAYQSGKSAVMAPLSAVGDAAIEMIDPSEWKYGWSDYSDFAGDTFQKHMDAIPEALQAELIQNLAQGLVGLGRGKLGKQPDMLPGVDGPDAGMPTKRRQSMTKAVIKHLGTDAISDGLEDLTSAGLALLVKKVVDEGGVGIDFTEEEVWDFLVAFGARAIKRAGTAAGKATRANAVDENLERTGAAKVLTPLELAHYRAHLEGEDMELWGGLSSDPTRFKAEFAKTRADIAGRAKDKPQGAAYEKWVLANPGHVEQRMATTYEEFEAQYAAGRARVDAIKKSPEYARLTPEEKRWFDQSSMDPEAILGLAPGVAKRPSVLDLGAKGGVDTFRKATENTAVSHVLTFVSKDIEKWDPAKKAEFEKYLRKMGVDNLPAVDDRDQALARGQALELVRRFGASYDTDLARRQSLPSGTGAVALPPQAALMVPGAPSAPSAGPDEPTQRMAAVQAPDDPDQIPLVDLHEGTVVDAGDANASGRFYDQMIADTPDREAAIYYNPTLGKFIVVQGSEAHVAVEPGQGPMSGGNAQRWKELLDAQGDVGAWFLVRHSHPTKAGETSTTPLNRFPSSGMDATGKVTADMSAVMYKAQATGQPASSMIDYDMPWGKSETTFGYDPFAGKFFVDYPTGYDDAKKEERRNRVEFDNLDDYEAFLDGRRGELASYDLNSGGS